MEKDQNNCKSLKLRPIRHAENTQFLVTGHVLTVPNRLWYLTAEFFEAHRCISGLTGVYQGSSECIGGITILKNHNDHDVPHAMLGPLRCHRAYRGYIIELIRYCWAHRGIFRSHQSVIGGTTISKNIFQHGAQDKQKGKGLHNQNDHQDVPQHKRCWGGRGHRGKLTVQRYRWTQRGISGLTGVYYGSHQSYRWYASFPF